MSNELWQQAKEALAAAIALEGNQRSEFLAELEQRAPAVHSEVVSLMSAQVAAEQAGFLAEEAESLVDENEQETLQRHQADGEDTLDAYQTGAYDPERTREYVSTDDLASDAPRLQNPAAGLVGDDYELEKKIGQGGMGVVYKAYHRSLRRTVALKIITGGGLRDEVDIARFHIEAEAAARLDHPGIIPVYDVGEHKGNHYYAMAYVEGPSLSKFVGSAAQKLSPRRAAELMEQVCHAVQYAHDRAVIHRDLKPANIMLEEGKIPRLADFGLAKNMHEEDGLTMTGQVMGTPSYMAPEQATGKLHEISNRTDVYSLGATFYALLAGKPPFAGGTLLETIRQVVRAEAEPLTQIVRSIPRDLQTVCEKCLAKRPEDRYGSADEMAEDLRRYLDGFPISARPLARWERAFRWCQRNPVESALLAITTAAILVGSIVSVRFGIEANRQAAVAHSALAEATQNAQQLRAAMKDSFVFASEDVLAQEPGMQAARAVLLKTAEQYYAELVKLTPQNAQSQRELAEAQFMLGKVQMALGQDDIARETLSTGLGLQQQLVKQSPTDAALLTALAKTHNQLATLAQKKWQRLTQLRDVGKLSANQASAAEQQVEAWKQNSAEVIRLRKEVVELQPKNLESQRLLASAMMNEGSAVSIRGYALKKLIDQDRARDLLLEAQKVRLGVLQEFPDEVLVRRDLGRGYYNLANTELRAAEQELQAQQIEHRWQGGADDLTAAIRAYQKLPTAELTLDNQLELTRCYRLRADAFFKLRQSEEAARDYRQAKKLLRSLTSRNPNVYRYRTILAETQFNYCCFLFIEGQDERATAELAQCRATLLQSLRIDPNNLDAADQLVRFTQSIAEPLLEDQGFDLANDLVQEAIEELLALQKESPEYSALSPFVEKLQASARQVRKQREKAENPEDVT